MQEKDLCERACVRVCECASADSQSDLNADSDSDAYVLGSQTVDLGLRTCDRATRTAEF